MLFVGRFLCGVSDLSPDGQDSPASGRISAWGHREPIRMPELRQQDLRFAGDESAPLIPHIGQDFGTFTNEEVVVFCEKWEVDGWRELFQMYLQICNLVGFSTPDRYQLFKVLKLRSFGRWQDGLDVLRAAIASMVKAAWLTFVLRRVVDGLCRS